MSTEHREIRPFDSVRLLEDFLNGMQLHVGDIALSPGESKALETDVYLRVGIGLNVGKSQSEIEALLQKLAADETMSELDLTVDDLEFVVVASSPFLKIVDFIERSPLSELVAIGAMIDVSGDPRCDALLSPNSGCDIDVMICLSRPKKKAPLRPWRRGTWLSRISFSISTEQALTGFTPRPMDAAKKKELGIAPSTARYITMSSSPLDEGVSEDEVEMWIDADLLAQMSAMPKSKGSMALQRQIFVDAVSAIIYSAQKPSDDADVPLLKSCTWPDIEKSLLGRVISALAPNSKDPAERLLNQTAYLEMVRNDPAKFLTFAEHLCGVSTSFNELMEA
jgi:hypothetical protein